MNRSELVRAVAERAGSEEAAARRHVDAVVETVMERVSAGERVIITGFGTFDRASRPARKARNPRTGLPIEVSAAEVPRFRVGQTFRNRVGQSVSVPEEQTAPVPVPEPVVALVAEKVPSKKSKDGKAVKESKTVKGVKGGKKAKKGLEKPKGEKGAAKATKRPGKAKAAAKPGKVGKASKAVKVGK
ncbi:HU family DNA-binding protein [Actinomadura decatromicini]|uniref:HU family DNA-binding protein n=1 Tax=Actinomadura decatromicini TaxID=2604572 RepID=A0A5D3F705_9ACTN|nr:HU family DNA-binding protein [Actinomadura decatromicini]TYK43125.1 HU family DNA-binding protein [Actinomadura decatromicini]